MSLTPDMTPPWEQRKIIDQQADTITRLTARMKELEGQHKGLVLQNALLRQRPDLPVDRIPATKEVEALTTRVKKLEGALEMFACDCIDTGYLCYAPQECRNYIARAALDEKQ